MNNQAEQLNVFITDDIIFKIFDYKNTERYKFTSSLKNGDLLKEEYGFTNQQNFEKWAKSNLSFEELYQIPKVSLYYYPSAVKFSKEDRYKCSKGITLVYDRALRKWAVGMIVEGMDYSPHLLDTFIALGKGVPVNIAKTIQKNYLAYMEESKHLRNCELLAEAWEVKAEQCSVYAERLK